MSLKARGCGTLTEFKNLFEKGEGKMKKLVVFSVFCGFLAMFWGGFFAPQARAILGDVNNDGEVSLGDVVYLITYLFKGGPPPPNPIDADVDGSPGINVGDVFQLISYRYPPFCDLLPYTGVTVRVGSKIRFSADLIDFSGGSFHETTQIKIIQNGGHDLMGMVIPLSYANRPNEVEVTIDSVSFAGSIIPPDWSRSGSVDNGISWPMPASIDNDNKIVLILPFADQYTDTPLDSGTTGLVATLYFTKIADGDPLALSTTEKPPSHSLMLISSYCADTFDVVSPSERIFTPMLPLALNGDVNCDGVVDLGDLVYNINYLYKSGPPPCGM